MNLAEVVDLMRALSRRGVPARWCQSTCPTIGGDQKVTIQMAVALPPDGLLVEAGISGYQKTWGWEAEAFDHRGGFHGWFHRVTIRMRQEGGRWRGTHYSIGYIADTVTGLGRVPTRREK